MVGNGRRTLDMPSGGCILPGPDPSGDPQPRWRNWQTRQLEVLVGVKSRGGSSPLLGIQDDPGRKAGVVVILRSRSTRSRSTRSRATHDRAKTGEGLRWSRSGVDPALHRRFGGNDGDQRVEGQNHGIEIAHPPCRRCSDRPPSRKSEAPIDDVQPRESHGDDRDLKRPSPCIPRDESPPRFRIEAGHPSATTTLESRGPASGSIRTPASASGRSSSTIAVQVCLKIRRFIDANGVAAARSARRRGSFRVTPRTPRRQSRGVRKPAIHSTAFDQSFGMPHASKVASGRPNGASINQR